MTGKDGETTVADQQAAIHQEIARRVNSGCCFDMVCADRYPDTYPFWCFHCLLRAVSSGPSPGVWRDSRGYELPKYIAVIASEDGGVMLEGHAGSVDWEIETDAKGALVDFYVQPRAAPTGEASLPASEKEKA